MTHVRGNLVWNQSTFSRASKSENQLVLQLGDGSDRRMNFENWEGTVQITEKKLLSLIPGGPIRFATWEGYDQNKWFCDVECIENPEPAWFLRNLSEAWIVSRSGGGRLFNKFLLPCVDCSMIHGFHPLDESRHKILYYRINLFPLDPFFSTFRPSLESGVAEAFNNEPERWYMRGWSDIDRMSREISGKWHSLELMDFVKFLESKWYKADSRR